MLNMYGVRIEDSLEQQQYNANWRQQYEKEQEHARGVAIERIRTGTATQSQIDQIQRDSMPGGALDPNRLNAERAAAIQQAEFEAKNAKRAQEQAAAAADAEQRRLTAERQMSYNDRQKAAADAASAAATAAIQYAAERTLPNLIANAVATGNCNSSASVSTAIYQSGACQDYRDPQRKAIKDAMVADNKKKSDLASKKLADALTNKKAAVEKVKKSVSKLKEKAKNKKSFAKGIAKMKKNRGR